jgi:lantibiotic modifying enzyme
VSRSEPVAAPLAAWRPLLGGEAAARAAAAVDDIAAALREHVDSSSAREGGPAQSPGRDYSLAGGQAGLALFFAYCHLAEPRRGHDEVALRCLERAMEGVGAEPSSAGLYSGFPGVAWVLEHLRKNLLDEEGGDPAEEDPAAEEDPGEEVARVLRQHLATSPWRSIYDLIGGLAGFGVYALERRPHPGGQECLAEVVARLDEIAERRSEGISWRTPSEWLSPIDRERFPEGNFNLGVAHGVPGVIGLLGEVCAVAELAGRARLLLAGSVSWLLAQRLGPTAASRFSTFAAAGVEPTASRLAWCYGDLGIATSLLLAARLAGEQGWEEAALDVARATAARGFAASGVVDAGLCHGAAGVAHLYNRLYQASCDPLLEEAAVRWVEQTLAMRRPGEGVAGFQAWLPGPKAAADGSADLRWTPDPGFLTGAAGVGLALLAATTPVEPAWDRVLLASVPPRPAA